MMQIELERLGFYAYHGVLEQERTVGNHFEVSVTATVNGMRSMITDNVSDTISYADMYEQVASEMAVPSALLEHVAYRIVRRLFDSFDAISHLRIKVSKLAPPITGDIGAASIILDMERSSDKS